MIMIARSLNVKINVDSSSSNIVSVGFIFDIGTFTSEQYSWHNEAASSPSIGRSRKRFAYATIG